MKDAKSVVSSAIVAASMILAASGASAQTPSTPGHATVEGRVTKVDAKRGWVDVKTSQGSMKLHFPPPALDGVKAGDSLTVELGLTPDGKPAGTAEKK
jgi:hypothetical protein